jgi:nucleoside-diphosphate-sugar epimerase
VALASPANTVSGILAVLEVDRDALGGRTAINLPALTVTVGDMLRSLQRLAGPEIMDLISYTPDATVARIVAGWPARFDSARAARLGLQPDPSFDEVLQQYVRDHPQAITHPSARRALGFS